jgi:hypothetical protein
MNRIIALFLILHLCPKILAAQDKNTAKISVSVDSMSISKTHPILWWLTLGYGVSSIIDASFATALGAMLTISPSNFQFSVRVVHDNSGQDNKFPHQQVFDAGLLFGYGSHDSLWFWNTSIGVAYAHTIKRIYAYTDSSSVRPVDVYRATAATNIALALQAQYFSKFSSTSDSGLGGTLCIDINKAMSFWVLMLSLEIGIF